MAQMKRLSLEARKSEREAAIKPQSAGPRMTARKALSRLGMNRWAERMRMVKNTKPSTVVDTDKTSKVSRRAARAFPHAPIGNEQRTARHHGVGRPCDRIQEEFRGWNHGNLQGSLT